MVEFTTKKGFIKWLNAAYVEIEEINVVDKKLRVYYRNLDDGS